ncbi:5-formyltetrahydrofolate cyclo-ligase [Metabacillus sp. JX24]|uniref:5-formyltetrahydrofolate cyclo-ligase n=1 Tax=Metabacillus sp. JX24 TaxID=3240759 RepID=UPI00350F8457
MLKKTLRKQMLDQMSEMNPDTYRSLCGRIHKQLFQSSCWKDSKTIGITISRGMEVDTNSIIEKALQMNKRVAIPRCLPKTREMEFRTYTSEDQLEIVYYGLKEPAVSKTSLVTPDEMDLLFVPGVCFSKLGYRIGYGGGYYDRYLPSFGGMTVSLAFSEQILPELPAEHHDIPVRKIITEDEVIITSG